MIDDKELKEIEDRCKELTEEWCDEDNDEIGYTNGEMAPHYMQDVPRLIEEIRRLRGQAHAKDEYITYLRYTMGVGE